MAKDIADNATANNDVEFIFDDDADDSDQVQETTIEVSSTAATPSVTVPDALLASLRKMYKPSADRREKKPAKKTSRKKRAKKATSPVAGKAISLGVRARTSHKPRVSIYRLDAGSVIRLYANRKQAELAGQHYDRDVHRILQHDYYLRLRSDQILKLYGIRPTQVQPMADGSLRIRMVVHERRKHSYSATYTADSWEEVRRKVREGTPSATLGYTSKRPEVLEHILTCLGVRYTNSELKTLIGKLNDAIRYEDQLYQEIMMDRKNIYFSKRIRKSDRLIGVQQWQVHHPTRQCGRMSKSSRIVAVERGRILSK